MGENAKKLARYLHVYGFYGLFLFIQIYWLKRNRIILKNYGTIYIRKNTFDAEIFTQMFIYRQYDFEIKGDVKVIVDLGGNNGMSSLFFHRKYPGATIYVLEPDKENFNALQKHTAGIKEIVAMNKAIWKENGIVNLDSGDSWTVKIDMETGKNLADAITMDSLIASFNIIQIDLLKIDIESAEKEIFENAAAFLLKTKNMVIELHDWLRAGCAQSFFTSLYNYNYKYSVNHENTLITDLDLKPGKSDPL